jgi:PAS domain S-box-containing protein
MTVLARLGLDAMCQRTLDHLGALVRVWTPDEGVVYVNRAWRDLTGTTLDDNAGDGWLRLVHDADRAGVLLAIGGASGSTGADYRLLSKDGQPVLVSDRPSTCTDDESQRVLGVVHTVTVRDSAPSEDQGKSMSKWAHELRGPLNAILGWSDLLGSGDNDNDVMQRGLKAIANNARQQALIIKRMTE